MPPFAQTADPTGRPRYLILGNGDDTANTVLDAQQKSAQGIPVVVTTNLAASLGKPAQSSASLNTVWLQVSYTNVLLTTLWEYTIFGGNLATDRYQLVLRSLQSFLYQIVLTLCTKPSSFPRSDLHKSKLNIFDHKMGVLTYLNHPMERSSAGLQGNPKMSATCDITVTIFTKKRTYITAK